MLIWGCSRNQQFFVFFIGIDQSIHVRISGRVFQHDATPKGWLIFCIHPIAGPQINMGGGGGGGGEEVQRSTRVTKRHKGNL